MYMTPYPANIPIVSNRDFAVSLLHTTVLICDENLKQLRNFRSFTPRSQGLL